MESIILNRNNIEKKHFAVWILAVFTGISCLCLYASFSLIAYYADGAHYFMQIVISKDFFFVEPASRVVEIIQELPLLICRRAGMEEIYPLSVIFGMTLLFIPVIQTFSCYFILPYEKKELIVFPLLHLVIGTQASFFPVVTEAPITASCFWMLFYLLLFRSENTAANILTVFLSFFALYLHESMVFLAPLLIVAALWQFKKSSQCKRIYSVVLSFWFFYITCFDLMFIINPRSEVNRSDFISQLLELKWLYWRGFNTTAVLGLLLIVCIAFLVFFRFKDSTSFVQKKEMVTVCFFGLICIAATISVLFDFDLYGVATQFGARANSTLISFPLSISVFIALWKPDFIQYCSSRNIKIVITVFVISVLTCHTAGVYHWFKYIDTFGSIVNSRQGVISQKELKKILSVQDYSSFNKMSLGWTNPTLSILLSKNKQVKSIILNPPATSWQPFDPCDPAGLPQTDLFDIQPFFYYLSENRCSD